MFSCKFRMPILATGLVLVVVPVLAGELHKAARKGDVEAVRSIVAEDASDINKLDGVVGTPLHWAAACGHLDVANQLVDLGATIDAEGGPPDRLTPLQVAASSGHLLLVAYFLEHGADLSVGTSGAGTPLHLAAYGDHASVVLHLLEAGADPYSNIGSNLGVFPLHWAARTEGRSVIAPILETGFPVDHPTDEGTTALHIAAFLGQVEFARALLEAGADPDAHSSYLTTPRVLMQNQEKMQELFKTLPLN